MLYPISIKLHRKHCVVIGGGKVASRKINSLIEAKAIVTVISPKIVDEIETFVNKREIFYKQKDYEKQDLNGAFLIIAATNNEQVNKKIYDDKQENQMINIVDNPELSDFFVPATISRGKLSISVSTSGASPGLARKLKKELSTIYDKSYENYVDFLYASRKIVKETQLDEPSRKEILKSLLDPVFMKLTRDNKLEERQELLEGLVKEQQHKNK